MTTNRDSRIVNVKECWVCGRMRAFDKHDEKALDRVWKRAWEIVDSGIPWKDALKQSQKEHNVQIIVKYRYYCGC